MTSYRDASTLPSVQPDDLEGYRRELTGYCYRMLGSGFEAEDAVQDTMLRAWRSAGQFEGRSSVRSWLYRIATNVCVDMIRGRNRRARPMEFGPSSPPEPSHIGEMLPEHLWVSPIPDARVLPEDGDPADIAVARDTVRLAFITALQHLPARQRVVLILCEVLRWSAAEVAELLDTSVPAVNSAVQRARATLREQWPDGRLDWAPAAEPDPGQRRLLQRFIDAHEQADPEALIALLRHDVRLAISPQGGEWNGEQEVGDALRDGMTALGQWRVLPIMANGQPGAAGYLRRPGQTAFVPFALTVLRLEGGRVTDIAAFEQPSMFTAFGLPATL